MEKAQDVHLRKDENGVYREGAGMVLRVAYAELLERLKPSRLSGELLVRAAKLKSGPALPVAIDATAGLGEDALLLAAAGFDVLLFEHDPIIAALLKDAVRRARETPALSCAAGRMHVFEEDSVAALGRMDKAPDLVYLDPMFPERRKSAAVKKKFQLLQRLEAPQEDAQALLQAAIAAGPQKIVIKRPLKGPSLGDVKPSHSVRGKAVRFDVIVLPQAR